MSQTSRKLSRLSKQSHIAIGSLVAGAGMVAAATGAQAKIIGLEIKPVNDTAKNGSFAFDLNDDGIKDFEVLSKEGSSPGKGFAKIKSLNRITLPSKMAVQGLDTNGPSMKFRGPGTGRIASLKDEGRTVVERFDTPGQVDGSSDFKSSAFFYNEQDATGPFLSTGDVGYIGLSLTFGEKDICCKLEEEFRILEDGMDMVHMGDDEDIQDSRLVFYGWAEVVRGSLTVNRIGFQTIAGAAAPIPGGPIDVPEPATLPLLALGAAGLAAMRRRKAVAA